MNTMVSGSPGHDRYVVFRLDEGRYALRLSEVERVIRAVEITHLPDAPANVLGVIDIAGTVLPVVDLRRRFGLGQRAIAATDHIVIAHAVERALALVVDEVEQVIDGAAAVAPDRGSPESAIDGIVSGQDGLILIHDLDRCLSAADMSGLETAMRAEAARGR